MTSIPLSLTGVHTYKCFTLKRINVLLKRKQLFISLIKCFIFLNE